MAIVDPNTAAERWVNGGTANAQKYAEGVAATTKDPTQLAIAQQGKLVSNFNQAVQSGRWARALAATGSAGWKAAVAAKGAANFSTGISAGRTKYAEAVAAWFPFMSQVQSQISNMPRATLADSIARSAAWQTALYNRKRGI